MNYIKKLIVTLLFFLLVSCGSHKRGTSVPFPENGVVAQIIQLDERTAQLELNWYGGGMSELIIRDSGRGPLFKAVVPSGLQDRHRIKIS